MRVIKFDNGNMVRYFDYNKVINTIKENEFMRFGCVKKITWGLDEKISVDYISITPSAILLDDRFEILDVPDEKEIFAMNQLVKANRLAYELFEDKIDLLYDIECSGGVIS